MMLAAISIIGGVVILVGLGIAPLLLRRAPVAAVASIEPRSLVRLLRTDEELREAIETAAGFERQVADAALIRAGRYEEEAQSGEILHHLVRTASRAERDESPGAA